MQVFWQSLSVWLRFLIIFPLLFLNGFLFFLLFKYIGFLLNYIIIAALLAFLLKLTVSFFVNKGINEILVIAGVGLTSLITIFLIGFTLLPLIFQQLGNLITELPNWINNGTLALEKLSQIPLIENLGIDTNEIIIKTSKALNDSISSLGSEFLGVIQGTLDSVISTLVILILTIFFLVGGQEFSDGVFDWFPIPWNEKVKDYLQSNFKDYFVSRLILAGISSLARAIVFIPLGIPYGITLAFGLGIASLIPFASSTITFLITILLFLNNVIIGVKFFVSALIIEQITDNLIAPKIIADKIGLNPIWIIISIFLGAKIGGFVGLLIAVPVASVIKRIAEDIKKETNLEEK